VTLNRSCSTLSSWLRSCVTAGKINDGYTFQFRSCGVGGNHYKTFFFMHEIVPVRSTYGTYGLDSTSPHKIKSVSTFWRKKTMMVMIGNFVCGWN
jgi:hypothetical protein